MTRLTVIIIAFGATVAFASSLSMIPPYEGPAFSGGGTFVGTATQGRAVSPDGRYIVGTCSGADDVGPRVIGIIWDGTSPSSRHLLSSDNAIALEATGVGYRTVDGVRQVVVFGNSAGWPTNWFADDVGLAGLAWLNKLRDTSVTMNMNVANTMAGTTTDVWYNAMWRSPDELAAFIQKGSGSGDPPSSVRAIKSSPSPQRMTTRGISATGRAVGTRRDTDGAGTNRRNMYLTFIDADPLPSPTQTFFRALDGVSQRGEAWSVSADGDRIFGLSPKVVGSPDFYPYMYTVSTDTIEPLPVYPDTGGSVTLGVPYGASADGNYAVGQNYRGLEKAVLWDVSDPDPVNWRVFDLTDFFAASEEGLGGFTRLARAYSVGVEDSGNIIVTGIGVTTDATTQGFVARLTERPQPTGACCIEHVGFRSCISPVFAEDCPGTFAPNVSCASIDCPTCPTPFADADFDGDVDVTDFAVMQRCLTIGGGSITEDCECFDTQGDGHIDQTDVEKFVLCGTGSEVDWVSTPNCP